MATVRGVDLGGHRVVTDEGEVRYDYLVLSAGSVDNFFGIASAKHRCFTLKDLDGALALRNHVLRRFEEAAWTTDAERRRSLMSFAVIGGGPSGVEFTGALSELIHLVLRKDFPRLDLEDVRVQVVEAAPHLLGAFAEPLRRSAETRLRKMGVQVLLDAAVEGVEDDAVRLKDGRTIPAGTVVWTAGVRAAPLADQLGVACEGGGRVPVQETLQLHGHPEVYVIGDMALTVSDGNPLPQLAGVAQQEGACAARNIKRQLRGLQPELFRYFDKGTMATIGRNAAVVDIRGIRITGFLGWVTWLLVHLLLLVSFRNRLLVLLSWAYDYFFYDRPVRLIVRADSDFGIGERRQVNRYHPRIRMSTNRSLRRSSRARAASEESPEAGPHIW